MKRIVMTVVATLSLLVTASAVAMPPARAIDVFPACQSASDSAVCKATGTDNVLVVWKRVLTILSFVIGAIAVLMIIIGALRYTLSGGDSSGINSAKNTIIYAAVGLVLAGLAQAIVNFVLSNV